MRLYLCRRHQHAGDLAGDPAESAHISIEDGQWASEPAMAIRGYTDLYGNPCLRAVLPAGRSSFRYQAVAVVPDRTEEVDACAGVRARRPPG